MRLFLFIFLICFMPVAMMAQQDTPIEVTADNELSWDRANQKFTATGNASIVQGESSITAPTIIAHYNEADSIVIQKVVAEPDAVLIQPNEKLTADKVIADFEKGILNTVTAIDDVVLTTDTETLYGDKAVYDANDRIITVTGNVRIEQDKNVLTGNKATFDLKTSVSTMTASPQSGGRVKATFYSEASE